jgi:hypothetical protein
MQVDQNSVDNEQSKDSKTKKISSVNERSRKQDTQYEIDFKGK